MNVNAEQTPALAAAFEAFNHHSSRLEASYRELREQVAVLSGQLVSEQTARHRELLEKERLSNRLLRTVEALPGAVVVLDDEGIVRERNRKAADLLDRPLVGLSWADIVRRECAPNTAANGDLWLNDGRCLSLSRQTLAPEPGEILLLTDVTDSRRLAELLQRSDRLTAIGEMTACLAHQIRTPIASALLNLSLLGGGNRQLQLKHRVGDRLREVMRIVDSMLQFAAGAKPETTDFCIAELLREVAETFRGRLLNEELLVDVHDVSLKAVGNRDALKGAIQNLVENAYQAIPTSPRIELGAAVGEDSIFLTVSDNGPGIDKAIREQLFDPFFTTRPQGTGLGLAVVRSVIKAHGGEVLVESSGRGTTFTLCLPNNGETR